MIPLMKVHMAPKEAVMPTLVDVLYSGFLSEGTQVKQFEQALQSFVGCKPIPLSVNSCTSALQLAYRCALVRHKLVLATPMTCTATNMSIFPEGGRIVWCDINPRTGNIDPADVERKLQQYGEQLSAISFVDFAGYPADLTALMTLGEKYLIPLIEDAAQSLGARYDDYNIGANPNIDYTAFSFQAIKHLTTGDGGALICQSPFIWELAKKLKWYGINREAAKEATRWHYDIPDYGYKFHMNNINAAIGLAQLEFVDDIIQKHKSNGQYFDQALQNIDGLQTMYIPPNSQPSYWVYMIKVDRRDDFARMMESKGIAVNVAHIRNDKYSCFQDRRLVYNPTEELPGLTEFNDRYIAIPCGWWVTEEDREYITTAIKAGW